MPTKKRAGKAGGTRPARKLTPLDGKASSNTEVPAATEPEATRPARKTLKISTVSHTLDSVVAERLRYFAFHERVSESAVIEFALREFFKAGDDAALGRRLRESGAALRRKS
ncbi:MAG: hypothetical protein ACLPYS_08905 [Vulcanimicrobiaceae bacterium]